MFGSIERLVGGSEGGASSRRVWTIPNAISLARLLLIPVFVWLLSNDGAEGWGIGLLVLVVASDWVDGYIARRTNSVSDLGKLLDPFSDRIVIAAALITFTVQGVFPLWATVAVVGRDVLILAAGIAALAIAHRSIAVRWIGKVATFDLMVGIPMVAWGGLGLPMAPAALACGWPVFLMGLCLYYLAAGAYVVDLVNLFRGTYEV